MKEKVESLHPIRVRILEILAERRCVTAKEIRELTGLPPGTLYHHLRNMRGLVKSSKGNYIITRSGIRAYRALLLDGKVVRVKGAPLGPLSVLIEDRRLGFASSSIIIALSVMVTLTLNIGFIPFHIYRAKNPFYALTIDVFGFLIIFTFLFILRMSLDYKLRGLNELWPFALPFAPLILVGLLPSLDSFTTKIFYLLGEATAVILFIAYLYTAYLLELRHTILISFALYLTTTLLYFIFMNLGL
jgi:DNA-binding transcriptional ArsR family regulator